MRTCRPLNDLPMTASFTVSQKRNSDSSYLDRKQDSVSIYMLLRWDLTNC